MGQDLQIQIKLSILLVAVQLDNKRPILARITTLTAALAEVPLEVPEMKALVMEMTAQGTPAVEILEVGALHPKAEALVLETLVLEILVVLATLVLEILVGLEILVQATLVLEILVVGTQAAQVLATQVAQVLVTRQPLRVLAVLNLQHLPPAAVKQHPVAVLTKTDHRQEIQAGPVHQVAAAPNLHLAT